MAPCCWYPDTSVRSRCVRAHRVVYVLQVRSIDAAKRAWGDKDEWKKTLKALVENGKLEFIEESDNIKFDLPEQQQ